MNLSLQSATSDHLPGIYALVKELAKYENASPEVTLSLDDYYRLFLEGWFEAIVALEGDEVVGTCVYYNAFSTWKGKMLFLEDFVVRQSMRKAGVGQQLFDYLIALAKDQTYDLIKWQVLDWNEPAIRFYEKNKAQIDKKWWNGKIILKDQ